MTCSDVCDDSQVVVRDLVASGASPHYRKTFDLVRFSTFVDLFDTEADAVARSAEARVQDSSPPGSGGAGQRSAAGSGTSAASRRTAAELPGVGGLGRVVAPTGGLGEVPVPLDE